MFTRVLDLAVLLLLGVVIILPRPDVMAKPALAIDESERDRVAELQTRLVQAPGDAEAALGLADIFLDARRPDWALSTLSDAILAHPADHRLAMRRSLALADHFQAHLAYESAMGRTPKVTIHDLSGGGGPVTLKAPAGAALFGVPTLACPGSEVALGL